MEILIKSTNTSLLENIVDALRKGTYIDGSDTDCYIGDRDIEVNEENKELVIINIE